MKDQLKNENQDLFERKFQQNYQESFNKRLDRSDGEIKIAQLRQSEQDDCRELTQQFNEEYKPILCSMKDYDDKLCDQQVYNLQKRNPLYIEQWYHRNISKYDDLSIQQKQTLRKSIIQNLIIKLVYIVYKDDLFETTFTSNSFQDSMMSTAPSRLSNYKNAAYETCIPGKHKEAFDPRCRDWYKQAVSHDTIQVNVPFLLQSTWLIGVVVSGNIKSSENDSESFVSGMNVSIENLREKILSKQDNDDVSSKYESYSVFFHENNATIFNHRYWNRTSKQLKSWDQVEYNKTASYLPEEKQQFINNVKDIINFADSGQYSIEDKKNITQFFISFSRDNIKYLGLVYPLQMAQLLDMNKDNTQFAQSNFLIGRVHRDIRGIIEEANFNFSQTYQNLSIGETIFTSILVLISILHYAAFLYNAHDIPLQQLIMFLNRKDLNISLFNHNGLLQQKHDINISIVNQSSPQPNQNTLINLNNIPKQNINSNFLSTDIHNNNNNNNNNNQGTTILSKNFGSTAFDTSEMPYSNAYLKVDKDQKLLKTVNNTNLKNRLKLNSKQLLTSKKGIQRNSSSKASSFIKDQYSGQFLDQKTISLSHSNVLNNSNNSIQVKSQNQKSFIMELDDIQGIFKEMQVIIDTFKGLENVIRLAQFNQVAGNNATSIIHYSSLKEIVKKINNINAVGSCYMNLGLLLLRESKFQDAIIMFQASYQFTLQEMNIFSLSEFEEQLQEGKLMQNKNTVSLMQLLSKRLRLAAVAMIYSFQSNIDHKISPLLIQAQKLLNIAIQIQLIASNKQSQLQIQICSTLIAEIYFLQDKYDEAIVEIEALISSTNLPNINQPFDTYVSFHHSYKKIPLHIQNNGSFENLEQAHQDKVNKSQDCISTQSLMSTLQYLLIKFKTINYDSNNLEQIELLTQNIESSKYLEPYIYKNSLSLIKKILPKYLTQKQKDIQLLNITNQTQQQFMNNQFFTNSSNQIPIHTFIQLQQNFQCEIERQLDCYNEKSYDLLFLIDTSDMNNLGKFQQQIYTLQLIGEQFLKCEQDSFSIQTYGKYTSTICSRIPFINMSIYMFCLEQLQRELQKQSAYQNSIFDIVKLQESMLESGWAESIHQFLEKDPYTTPISIKSGNQRQQTKIAINIGISKCTNQFLKLQQQNLEFLIKNPHILQNFSQILNLNLQSTQKSFYSINNFDENILLLKNQLTTQNSVSQELTENQSYNKYIIQQIIQLLQQQNRYFEANTTEILINYLTSKRKDSEVVNRIYLI